MCVDSDDEDNNNDDSMRSAVVGATSSFVSVVTMGNVGTRSVDVGVVIEEAMVVVERGRLRDEEEEEAEEAEEPEAEGANDNDGVGDMGMLGG